MKVEPGDGDLPKKPRLDKPENRSSPIAFLPKDLPLPDFSDETNADDFAMEMGLVCVVCRCAALKHAAARSHRRVGLRE